ncbi:hypothetical protein WJ971_08010 [Achromobacter xylosoxidans]
MSSLGAYQLEVTLGRGAPIRNDAWGTAAAEACLSRPRRLPAAATWSSG